jgi:tRNA dimethylallyltransferase
MAVQPRVILIAGPTASGKSALALQLAERLGGVVVNADSMQVYRDLRILTSRPGPDEEARAPHMLYGHIDAADAYSVGRFLADAADILSEKSSVPIIFVGGTGLYLEALIHGLSTAPHIPDTIRSHWRERSGTEPAEALHAELERRDPVMAGRLRPGDSQRIVRALEVVDATGISLARWQESSGVPLLDAAAAT